MQQNQTTTPETVRPPRRVGTFTLGILLILIGVLIPCGMIWGRRVWMLLRFSPAILIVLGIEVLFYATRYREGKFKYDWAAILLVILLLMGTLAVSGVTALIHTVDEWNAYEEKTCAAIEDLGERALRQAGVDGNAYAYSREDDLHWLFSTPEQYHYGLSLTVQHTGEEALTKEVASDFAMKILEEIRKEESVTVYWLGINWETENTLIAALELDEEEVAQITTGQVENRLTFFTEE